MAKIQARLKQKIDKVVQQFNDHELKGINSYYATRYKGRYLYLDRNDYGTGEREICRLTYTGERDNWEFAIFKHSRDRYDPEEMFFPGAEFVDGTIEGAMKAGLEAYPINAGVAKLAKLFRRFVYLIVGGICFMGLACTYGGYALW